VTHESIRSRSSALAKKASNQLPGPVGSGFDLYPVPNRGQRNEIGAGFDRRKIALVTILVHRVQHSAQSHRLGNDFRNARTVFHLIAIRGNDDHGHTFGHAFLLHDLEEFDPAHDGHHQIEKDDARALVVRQRIQTFLSIANSDDAKAFTQQDFPQRLANVFVVLDNQHHSRTVAGAASHNLQRVHMG
jgi:hypothetical protein